MHTQCNGKAIPTGRIGSREVVVDFDGGRISSDASALLLQGVDQALKLTERLGTPTGRPNYSMENPQQWGCEKCGLEPS